MSAVEKFPKNEIATDNYLVIKSGYDLHKVLLDDVVYIESDSEYVNYYFENGKKIMDNQSLSKLVNSLPDYFMRVHRSYIVNKHKITGLKSRGLLLSNYQIPVSDSYYDVVKKEMFSS